MMLPGQVKDMILNFIIENYPKERVSSSTLHKELIPDVPFDQIRFLLQEIKNNSHSVADIIINERETYISSTGMTGAFLISGGFTEIESDESSKKNRIKEKETIDLEKSKIDLELSKRMLKEYPRTKWFARIGFFIGVALAILQIIKWLTQS